MDDQTKFDLLNECAERFFEENEVSLKCSELARTNFTHDGRGLIGVEIAGCYTKSEETSFVSAEWFPIDKEEDYFTEPEFQAEVEKLISIYDPKKEYVLLLCAPEEESEEKTATSLMICPLFDNSKKPSHISIKQIRKRLKRMLQAGQRLIILNTSDPDFMGHNLEKWMKEIKRFNKWQDGSFSVMINSSPEFPAILPDDLKADVLTVPVQ